MGQIGKGLEYVRSIPFILKIVEFVTLLIAISTVGYFLNNAQDITDFFLVLGKKGNLQFFMFAVVVGWLLVIAMSAFFVSGLHEKVSAINWPLTVAIISVSWTLLLLISSSMVADTARHYATEKTFKFGRATYTLKTNACDFLHDYKMDPRCGQLIGGAVCGFVAMILFAFDIFIHFRMYMTRDSAPKAMPSAIVT